jgi:hypothetical protein
VRVPVHALGSGVKPIFTVRPRIVDLDALLLNVLGQISRAVIGPIPSLC